jgi:hypothetical protein
MVASIMRLAPALISLSAAGFFFSGPEASAQSSRGAMGAQTRADVRISVTVLPRFQAKAASGVDHTGHDAGSNVLLAINAPHLRYSVVRLDDSERPTGSSRTRTNRLLVIVPD